MVRKNEAGSPSVQLSRVARLLDRGVDLETIVATIVDEIVKAVGADRGTLYLVDRARGQLFSKAAHLPELKEIRLDIGVGIAGTVAKTGKTMRIADPYAHPLFNKAVDKSTGYKTETILTTPLIDKHQDVIGVLQVLNKKSGGAFDERDEETLKALAVHAAEVIARTSLYQELRLPRPEHAPLDYRYNFIVGTSTLMRQVYELVDKAARTDATVILQGESGTGKGLIARAIHLNSARKDKPFVTIDCTSLPPSLIESELFGHEKGAFTGADRQRPGKFEAAEGGTIFIDEIGELPLELQSKLLRVIQDGEFERIGGRETLTVNFRLIAATHRNLDQMVASGTFRADLYYRIRVVPILLPPLRDRGAIDVRRLAEHFLDVFAEKHRRPVRRFSDAAMQRLCAHTWPGNIRELENCVESAVVLADGEEVRPEQLNLPETVLPTRVAKTIDLDLTLAEMEQRYARAVLDACGGNQSEAARRLDISRNTLARLLKVQEERTP
ncbi:MAG: sigma-54-dependent Fis family transcriptional regulator [Deltaproteobacteria bacterium]|nr:sigma-54-dependent Fis family transcriptional regulator [Deltaproteobacteria bacterium]